MLGFYEGFPATVHKIMHFGALISNRTLQQMLIESLHALTNQAFSLEMVTDPSIPECQAVFEFGIAEADGFDYLDDDETAIATRAINKKPLQTMDLFCVVRYYKLGSKKKISLRFDYNMIRFTFNKGLMAAYVFHERGPRYTSPEDIIKVIVNKVNETASRKVLKQIS
jgi:hypothetical protein